MAKFDLFIFWDLATLWLTRISFKTLGEEVRQERMLLLPRYSIFKEDKNFKNDELEYKKC
jgi:hypothetical protein